MPLRLHTALTAAAAAAALLVTTPLAVPPASAVSPVAQAHSGHHDSGHHDHRGGHHQHRVPTLENRATLSSDYLAEGPPSGAEASPANGRTGPFDGQVIPGFSAMVENRDGTFWAMPDNGFGNQQNSADFLLRLYRVAPAWETKRGGDGEIEVEDFIQLSDPDGHIDFPIVHEDTEDRLLTGNDFDVESLVKAKDGTFWIGEEFGPFLLHVDSDGELLQAPVPLPDQRPDGDGALKSPQNQALTDGEEPLIAPSKGFEAMAVSKNGRYLYPILEGAVTDDDDQRRRWIFEYDTRRGEYTQRAWQYEADTDANLVGDAFFTRDHRLLILERDDFDGPASVTKRVYEVDLRETDDAGHLEKDLVVDLLKIDNPHGIGTETSPDAYGVDEEFSFPMQSVEVVLELRDGRLLIANDNNYPGNDARYPGTPDDTEMFILDVEKTKGAGTGKGPGQRQEAEEAPVIGHRGASGYRPEHTLAAYGLAMNQCADYIEPDLVSTADGVLVARHENEIGGTTDVARHPEFADRRTTKTIDGRDITGWFTEDFTLAELRTLRAQERIPQTRPDNTGFDGLYVIPTFEEVVDLARHSRTCDGQPMGLAPEIKHPSYFDSIGLSMEEGVAEVLEANDYDGRKDPVVIQSFETQNLKDLDEMTDVSLAQLVNCSGAPYDLVAAGDPRTYADLTTRSGLREITRYADILGACKDVMIPRNEDDSLAEPSGVIRDAHRAGLEVHGWTFRAENQFLPTEFRSSDDPAGHGDLAGEIEAFLDAGMDGIFSDHPDLAVAAATDAAAERGKGHGQAYGEDRNQRDR